MLAFQGAIVIAIDMDDASLRLPARWAPIMSSTRRERFCTSRLQAITDNRGPDVVIEAIGLALTFRAAVEEVAFTGRVVYIGYAKEPVTYETRLFVHKELPILGSRNALPEDFGVVIRMLEAGRFPVEDAEPAPLLILSKPPEPPAEWSAHPGRFTNRHGRFSV